MNETFTYCLRFGGITVENVQFGHRSGNQSNGIDKYVDFLVNLTRFSGSRASEKLRKIFYDYATRKIKVSR